MNSDPAAHLKAFISKVQSDPNLQNQLRKPGANAMEVAKLAGFNIGDPGGLEISFEESENSSEELDLEQLQAVAGGESNLAPGEFSSMDSPYPELVLPINNPSYGQANLSPVELETSPIPQARSEQIRVRGRRCPTTDSAGTLH